MQFNTIRVFNIYITVDKTKSNRSSTRPQMYDSNKNKNENLTLAITAKS